MDHMHSKSSNGLDRGTTSSEPSMSLSSSMALSHNTSESAAYIARKARSESFRARQKSFVELAKDPSIRRQRNKHLQENSAESSSHDYLPEQSTLLSSLKRLRSLTSNFFNLLGNGNESFVGTPDSDSDGVNSISPVPSSSTTALTHNTDNKIQDKSGSSSSLLLECHSERASEAPVVETKTGSPPNILHPKMRTKFNFEDHSLEVLFENERKRVMRALSYKAKEKARLKKHARKGDNVKPKRFRIHTTPAKQKLAFSGQEALLNLEAGEYVRESDLSIAEYIAARKECAKDIQHWIEYKELVDPIAAHFKHYRLRWKHILLPSSAPRITFSSIPWPTLMTPRSSSDITKEDVKNYLLLARFGPNSTVNEQRRSLAMEELRYWAPAEFGRNIVSRVEDKRELGEINAAALTVRSALRSLRLF